MTFRDLLTAFNGVSITYDGIGNPLTYYNGYSYTFTWNGRELVSATKGSTSLSYKYGADGLRTQKTVGSTVYNYYYADGLLIRQTWGSNYMDFLYDETGSAYSFIYNGTQYYYVKNLQGDVMRIVDATGAVVANYTYDAWGKVTSSGSIGQINPIRYRGYYYDTDTGFYYLQSRYYDPAIKRFISADDTDNLGANRDFTSLNLYAYCGNNPIMRYDPYGYAWYHTVLNNLKGKMHRFSQTDLGKEILDVFSIVVSNVTIEGGICIGMNIGATINGVGFDVGTRMDIAGVEIKDGKIRFGHFGKSGGVLSAGVLAVGEESHTYENFGSTKRETTGSQTVASQEVGISKSNSMVFVVGYRYKVSFSWSETLKDIINYFEKK